MSRRGQRGFTRSAFARGVLPGLLLAACGSRSGLPGEEDQGAVGSGGGPGASGGTFPTGGSGNAGTGGRFGSSGGLLNTPPGTGGIGGVLGSGGQAAGAGGIPFPGSGGQPPVPPVERRLTCPVDRADPRLPPFEVGATSEIDGFLFATVPPDRYVWSVVTQDCDAIVQDPTYELSGETTARPQFTPGRPTGHTFRLAAEWDDGSAPETCQFEVQVKGRGVRIELCWDTSTSVDLDLYVHTPKNVEPFLDPLLGDVYAAAEVGYDACNPLNCPAEIRSLQRVDFGYPDSPLEYCEAGPSAEEFRVLGHCPNPRAGLDNNQSLASGTTETVQIDNPLPGDVLRVMAHNFSNGAASPSVFIYCGGQRVGIFPPPTPPGGFRSDTPGGFGVMWRPADIVILDPTQGITRCLIEPLQDVSGGPYITVDDPSY